MLLLMWSIAVGLASLSDAALYSCQSKTDMYQPKCKCDERDTYINLTCPIGEDYTVDVLLNPLDYSFEINCKNQFVKNTSFIPVLVHERIDQVDFFGFIDCSMTEFINLTSKLIRTKHIHRMALKKIKHMIPDVLKGFRIKILHVLESPLNEFPAELLYDIEGLEEIFINNNNITTLADGLFKKSKKLQRIDLGQNNIMDIPNNLFAELHDLTSLLLFGNKLSTINTEIFVGLNNLKDVELMTNQLVTIAEDAFIHLPQLSDLSLRNNQFKTFPAGLFKNNTKLETLKLTSNPFLMSLPEKFLANLPELTNVFIDYCNLSTIPENIFWGASKLSKLNLNFNNLKYLKKHLFRDTISLKELNLDNNAIETLEAGIFNKVKNLTVLNLSYNKLKVMDDTFLGLKNLENLYIHHNSLSNLTKNSLKHFKNLTLLDMSYNKLSLEPQFFKGQRYSILPFLAKLETLLLQHNEIPYIFSDLVVAFPSLKELNLAHNNLVFLDYSALQFVQDHTITVNLEHNKIITIDLSSAELVFAANKKHIRHANRIVLLSGNPINCDCRIYDLVRYIDGTMHEDIRQILHLKLNDIMCQTSKKYTGIPLISLKSESLICDLDDGPKLPMKCKQNIEEYYQFRQYDNRLIMNCSFKGLTEMPRIEFHNTSRYKTLGIEVLLSGNNITSLLNPGEGYDNVVELDLSYNNISEIMWIPPKIEVLKVHNNNLTYLNLDELSFINKSSVRNLTFHNNPWKCDCNLINFTKFLQANFKKVSNLHKIICDGDERRELTRLSVEDLCPNIQDAIAIICALLAFCGLLMAITVALYFQYKQQIKVWMYARNLCLYLITEEELDQDKVYDAFISFSHEDEDFVVGELLPGLEQKPHPFRLCVHFRDWQPGEFIATNIARSIDESRRTVVVLSPGFLRSEWGRMEFRTAHTEALKEGRARVIVIVYGDIGPVDDLDAELRAYLTTNTYIKWGTPWFWDNLRFALPHSSKHGHVADKSSCAAICKQPEKIAQLDQMDLIKEPCTPPAASTPPADAVRQMHDPLLHSALNVALVGGTLVNTKPDKLGVNNNHLMHIV